MKNLLKLNKKGTVMLSMSVTLHSTLSLQCIMSTRFLVIKQNQKATRTVKVNIHIVCPALS